MKCKKVRKNLSAYADGELKPRPRDRIAAHIASCRECSAELSRIQEVARAAKASVRSVVSAKEPPSDLRRQVMQALSPIPSPRCIPIPVRKLAAGAIVLSVVSGLFGAGLVGLRPGSEGNTLRRTVAVQRRVIAEAQRDSQTARAELLTVKARLSRTERELRVALVRSGELARVLAQAPGEEPRLVRPAITSLEMPGAQSLLANGFF